MFDAPVATAARASATGRVSMSTRPDPDGCRPRQPDFVFPSHLLYSLLFLSLPVVTQIRGPIIAGSSPPSPLPTTVRALHFYREKISAFSSLVDLRRTVLPTLGALSDTTRTTAVDHFFIFENKFKRSPRRDSNSRTNNTCVVAFEGYHYRRPPGRPVTYTRWWYIIEGATNGSHAGGFFYVFVD